MAALCRRLDGLPLAIELATGWIRLLSPVEILERSDELLDLLTQHRLDRPSRHRTIATAVEASYELLDPTARSAFAALAVFEAPFTVELAESVIDSGGNRLAAAEAVAKLVDASLLELRHGAGNGHPDRQSGTTLHWLNTVRAVASSKGDAARRDGRRRLMEAMVRLSHQAAPELTGPDQHLWMDRLNGLYDHLRTAFWLVVAERPEEAVALAASLWRFWYQSGRFSEGVAALETASELGRSSTSPPRRELAVVSYGLGVLTYLQGDLSRAARRWSDALAGYREVDDHHGVSATLSGLGMLEQYRGNLDSADRYFVEAKEVAEAAGEDRGVAVAAGNLASLDFSRGRLQRSGERFREAQRAFTQLGDRRGIADMQGNLGRLAYLGGRFDEARRYAAEARSAFEISDDPSWTGRDRAPGSRDRSLWPEVLGGGHRLPPLRAAFADRR